MVMRTIHRREFLTLAAAGGSAMLLRSAKGAGERRLEGIFPIMQTPFTDSGALDVETLAHEVQFLDRIGVQGMVWPQLASEFQLLSYDERLAGAEALVRANKILDAKTRPAVVIGVQASDIGDCREICQACRQAGSRRYHCDPAERR